MSNRFVKPSVHLVAETMIDRNGMKNFLTELGVPEWETDAASDAEELIEAGGKLCYLSFSTDLNKNLTKVGTRNNFDYLQDGILKTKHGSVIEHASVTFILMNVSRIVTHELVRHRAGTAFSQVSGRYVRSDVVQGYLPTCIAEDPRGVSVFERAFAQMEENVRELEQIFGIDEMTARGDFEKKKELTSAFRRLIGNGQANHIMFTGNHRTLRHAIEMRTSRHAEEEIRVAFGEVFAFMRDRYPALYADATVTKVKGFDEIVFEHSKV